MRPLPTRGRTKLSVGARRLESQAARPACPFLVAALRPKVASVATIAKPARHVEAGIGGDVAAVAAGGGVVHGVTDKRNSSTPLRLSVTCRNGSSFPNRQLTKRHLTCSVLSTPSIPRDIGTARGIITPLNFQTETAASRKVVEQRVDQKRRVILARRVAAA